MSSLLVRFERKQASGSSQGAGDSYTVSRRQAREIIKAASMHNLFTEEYVWKRTKQTEYINVSRPKGCVG
jgi:hypothetical protein